MALYPALDESIKLFEGHESENNTLIIIGEKGSSVYTAEIGENKIVDGLAKVNCRFLIAQLRNNGEEAYDNYYRQTIRLVQRVATKMNSGDDKMSKENPKMTKLGSESMGGWDIYKMSGTNVDARFLFAGNSSSLSSSMLTRYAEQLIKPDEASGAADKKGKSEVSSFVTSYLKKSNYSIDNIEYLSLVKEYPFQINGFAYVGSNDATLFKKYILVNKSELVQIISFFSKFDKTDDPAKTRANIIDFCKKLQDSYFGLIISSNLNYTFEDLLYWTIGKHSDNDRFRKIALKDLISNKLSDEDFAWLSNILISKKQKLESLSGNNQHEFEQEGEKFYWVPAEMLP
jgi:hypothetical protein